MTQRRFVELLSPWAPAEHIDERLLATERKNLELFGYGIKGFTLSMIETAIEVSDGRLPGGLVGTIIDLGKDMLAHPIHLLEGARDAVEHLAGHDHVRVMLITKGDLFDQESKLARSGLADLFWKVEVVSEKDEATYRRVLARHAVHADRFAMIGNSLRSDVLPVLGVGGHALHVPYPLTWAVEHADAPVDHARFAEISSLADVPEALHELARRKAISG
jgi:putative hydrolase of the HAD superfamily